ncbi:hypothetical protein L7F22_068549 [Adiantum nelumboides]|nr:hypothetical protein [Adiantum nelumboides]
MTSEALLHTPFLAKPKSLNLLGHRYGQMRRVCIRPKDIKQAYRQLARKYHPDVCPSHQAEESTRRFIEIQQAYETLSDPRLRAIYDHAVAMGRGSAATGRMPWMSSEVASVAVEISINLNAMHVVKAHGSSIQLEEVFITRFSILPACINKFTERFFRYRIYVELGINSMALRAIEKQSSEWKSQWESQLSQLRRRSEMKARKADSWSARVRKETGLSDG